MPFSVFRATGFDEFIPYLLTWRVCAILQGRDLGMKFVVRSQEALDVTVFDVVPAIRIVKPELIAEILC